MKIAILGGSGMAGSAVYEEAVKRGHEVVAYLRDEEKAKKVLGLKANIRALDVFSLTKEELQGYDAIVDAFNTRPDKAYLCVDLATKLIAMFRDTEKPRILFILGAGSLKAQDGKLVVDHLKEDPKVQPFINIPIQAYKELQFLRTVENVNWVGVSPSAQFGPGKAHAPKIGKDDLLFSSDGASHVTNQTMAIAILDELEKPEFSKTRFTVADE